MVAEGLPEFQTWKTEAVHAERGPLAELIAVSGGADANSFYKPQSEKYRNYIFTLMMRIIRST